MHLHANAKLGLAGRLALVRAVEEGLSLKAAAAAFSVSPATVHRWWHRWLEGGRQPSALLDRSSRPKRSPRLWAAELQVRICECRRQTGWGPRLVAGATGFAHSMVSKLLPATDSHAAGRPRRSRPTATSGRVLAICCIWTSTRASCAPATVLPATARSARASGCDRRRGSATTSRTRSSTTTPASPTSSSTPTRRQRRSPASSSARSSSSPSRASSRSG
jgi:hypothetical protein